MNAPVALVPLVVLLPLIGAGAALALGRRARAQRVLAVAALVGMLAVSIVMLVAADTGGPLVMEVGGWAMSGAHV